MVVIAKIKLYYSRKTGITNCNGCIGVVKRKQYLYTIIFNIIQQTKCDNISECIITGYSKKAFELFTNHVKSNIHHISMEE